MKGFLFIFFAFYVVIATLADPEHSTKIHIQNYDGPIYVQPACPSTCNPTCGKKLHHTKHEHPVTSATPGVSHTSDHAHGHTLTTEYDCTCFPNPPLNIVPIDGVSQTYPSYSHPSITEYECTCVSKAPSSIIPINGVSQSASFNHQCSNPQNNVAGVYGTQLYNSLYNYQGYPYNQNQFCPTSDVPQYSLSRGLDGEAVLACTTSQRNQCNHYGYGCSGYF